MLTLRGALCASCALFAVHTVAEAKPAVPHAAAAKPALGAWGVDLTGRDTSVKPGDDFWTYANGTWAKQTPIAPDRVSAGGFVTLADLSEARVRAIVEDLAKTPAKPGTPAQQIGDMYASWMDTATIEARGTAVLKPYFAQIDAAKDRAGLLKLFAGQTFFAPIGVGITPDPADPTHYVAAAVQGGWVCPIAIII